MSENKVTISVIIPCKDESIEDLERCLDSIIQQIYMITNIIFIDDNSSSDLNLSFFKEKLSFFDGAISLKNDRTLGAVNSINRGISYTESDYVHFLSVNDFIYDGLYFEVKKTLGSINEKPGIWSAMVDKEKCEGNKVASRLLNTPVISLREQYISPEKSEILSYTAGNWFTGTTMFFLKSQLEKNGGLNPYYGGLADFICATELSIKYGAFYTPKSFGYVSIGLSNSFLSTTLQDKERMKGIYHKLSSYSWGGKKVVDVNKFNKRFVNRIIFSEAFNSYNVRKINKNLFYILIKFIKHRSYDIFYFVKYRYILFYILKLINFMSKSNDKK